jgi:hypothetical protein
MQIEKAPFVGPLFWILRHRERDERRVAVLGGHTNAWPMWVSLPGARLSGLPQRQHQRPPTVPRWVPFDRETRQIERQVEPDDESTRFDGFPEVLFNERRSRQHSQSKLGRERLQAQVGVFAFGVRIDHAAIGGRRVVGVEKPLFDTAVLIVTEDTATERAECESLFGVGRGFGVEHQRCLWPLIVGALPLSLAFTFCPCRCDGMRTKKNVGLPNLSLAVNAALKLFRSVELSDESAILERPRRSGPYYVPTNMRVSSRLVHLVRQSE